VEGEQVIIKEVSDACAMKCTTSSGAGSPAAAIRRLVFCSAAASLRTITFHLLHRAEYFGRCSHPFRRGLPFSPWGACQRAAARCGRGARPSEHRRKGNRTVQIASLMPLDVAAKQRLIDNGMRIIPPLRQPEERPANRHHDALLIALFILFVATWIALFSRQSASPSPRSFDAATSE